MATKYRVKVNGKQVWKGESAKYDKSTIPAKYRERPTEGEVCLYVDDELVSVLVPIGEADRLMVEAARIADLGPGA